ncbi:MAG: hypothetical protein QMD99_20175 [Rhizobiaceae bacterium]|nr:hypothetical protein [Rhizobiaceae bacterium]
MSRWVRVDVSVFDHEFFASSEPFSEREAWLWLIANAAWKNTTHRVGNVMLDVSVGSLFATLRGLQNAWHWGSDKRVRSFLYRLENGRMVETKTDAGKTQITICNYARYQDTGRAEDAARTQAGRSADALKTPVHQDTNISSLRSEIATPAKKRASRLPESWSLPRAWGQWAVSEGYSETVIRSEAEKFRDYWISKPGKEATKLDWFATWRNWIRGSAKSQHGRGPPDGKKTILDVLNERIERSDYELLQQPTIDGEYETGPGTAADLLFLADAARRRS